MQRIFIISSITDISVYILHYVSNSIIYLSGIDLGLFVVVGSNRIVQQWYIIWYKLASCPILNWNQENPHLNFESK
jgi:hypothetical protein